VSTDRAIGVTPAHTASAPAAPDGADGEPDLAAECRALRLELDTQRRTTQALIRERDMLRDALQQRQRETAQRLASTLEHITDGYVLLDAAGRVTDANREALRLLGPQRETLIGRAVDEFFPGEIDTAFHAACRQALDEGRSLRFEAHAQRLGRWLEVHAHPGPDGLALYFRDVSERHAAMQALRASEERFKLVARVTADSVWDWNLVTGEAWRNEGFTRLFGYEPHEIGSGVESWSSRIHPDEAPRVVQGIYAVIDGDGTHWSDEFRFRRKDGSYAHVVDRGLVIRDASGRATRMIGGMSDLSERHSAERELQRLHRAQRMLGACNQALIRAEDEQGLLEQVCALCVEIGGYAMTWAGYAEQDPEGSVRPVAHAGPAEGFFDGLGVSWSADHPGGDGSIGRAIRGRELVVVEDIGRDPRVVPWRERALAHGFRACVALPLLDHERDRSFGVLALYASETKTFGEQEKALLEELANNLAFGITHLRARAERRRLHAAVLKVAAAVSSHSGDSFFEQLVLHMVDAVGAQAGFVARLDASRPEVAEALCGIVDGRPTGPFEYTLSGTPCAELWQAGTCVVLDHLAERFPDARSMRRAGARSLVGCRLHGRDGEPLGLLFVWFRTPLQDGGFVASTLQIFAARAAAEMERLRADARLRDQASLLDKAQDAIVVHGIDQRVTYWNRSAERLYGWTAEEALGRSIRALLHPGVPMPDGALEQATAELLADGEWTGELEQRRRDGSAITVEARWTLVRDGAGKPQAVLAIATDVSGRKDTERAMHRLAFYDPLTGLPNRQLLSDRLEQALAASARHGRRGALLFIDLDNFKTLNDTLGHDQGDLLLKQVGQRLAGCVRETDTVARFGGDEFLVMLQELGVDAEVAAHHTREVAQKILDTLSEPYRLDGHEHRCTPSIGIAPFLGHQHSAGELLKQTDLAMYEAKAAGRNALRFFDPAMQAAVSRRAALESDLRAALTQQEFVLHYQPQADAQGQTIGVEALMRWRHPRHGMVSPAEFIPLAEETGLIHALGQWVLDSACRLLADWRDRPGLQRLAMSVNVSPRQFHHPDFVEHVTDALRRSGAPAAQLKLELTESLLVDDMEAIIGRMELLQSLGVGFSLDDFGTGYSSLAYLKRLPLDQLKIDQSFVRDVLTDANDAAIARTIIALGQSLGQHVIAEGVETQAQRDLLLSQGCHGYQGYYLSRPLPVDELLAWLG
jgi:diguanylate cyclase (GGDEF)-like protein/PAS domain S-box-containing protein